MEICPRGQAAPVLGDVNADGIVDVSDPIAFENYLFQFGPDPVCREAADVNDDGLIELDDATVIVSYLVPGTQNIGLLDPSACANTMPWPEGPCAPLALELEAPARVTTARFQARLAIRSPTLAVQGWSASIRGRDCDLVAVTTDGTVAAEIWDDPPGLRHLGYSAAVVVPRGAIAYVTLSVTSEVTLPPSDAPQAILAMEIEGTVPASGCTRCELEVGDGLRWTGEPIDTAITAAGNTYRPEPPSKLIEVCAP
jgi:hypothetical protein